MKKLIHVAVVCKTRAALSQGVPKISTHHINVSAACISGTTPKLELYTTLARSQVEEDELILEENVDGMDFVAGAIFADSDTGSGTDVTLRLGYYLPGIPPHTPALSCRSLPRPFVPLPPPPPARCAYSLPKLYAIPWPS